ncbi:MAG: FAD-dependent oxidoreductase [Spirochaetales bacterium]|nr:FAD-dependent oxidoreductase [Spirochaetales bacterium]
MKIIVIGGGFAGLAALKTLKKIAHKHSIILIDKNPYTSMIPALPDLVCGKIEKKTASGDIKRLIADSITFKQDKITAVDFIHKKIIAANRIYMYDYLLVAAGSNTDFFGFNKNTDKMHTLDSIESALAMKTGFATYINTAEKPHAVICGAGYTGLELAVVLRYAAHSRMREMPITMVEYAAEIMPFLHASQRQKLKNHIQKKKIHVLLKSTVTDYDGKRIVINKGEKIIHNGFLCWTAGSKRSIDRFTGRFETVKDGRLITNPYLQLPQHPDVFIAGDSAAFQTGGELSRKSVHFAISSGRTAALNIIRLMRNTKLIKFKPTDPGWVLPLHEMGIGSMPGRININGKFALRLHYFMCGYMNYNVTNFLKFLKMSLRLVT